MSRFEEEHKEEIEREAFSIYQFRSRIGYPDTPYENWCRACEIIRKRYNKNLS